MCIRDRIIHHPSGARAEAREQRSQLQNKRAAFKRMADTGAFKVWIQRKLATKTPEQLVTADMADENLLVEVRTAQGWTPIS